MSIINEQALAAFIDSRIAAALAAAQAPAQAAAQAAAPAPADPFAGLGTVPVQPVVTPEMIHALITPLVANEATKAKLSAAMQALGVATLPDAKPEQLPALYAAFQQVAAEANGAPATGGTPSII